MSSHEKHTPPVRRLFEEALRKRAHVRNKEDHQGIHGLFGPLSKINIGVIITDAIGRIKDINVAAELMTGWKKGQALGQLIEEVYCISDGDDETDVTTFLRPDNDYLGGLRGGQYVQITRRDGNHLMIKHSLAPAYDENDWVNGVMLFFQDVSEHRLLALRSAHHATHDALTGLFNRQTFMNKLADALEDAKLGKGTSILCYLNLRNIKLINSTCGHEAGDDLLQWVAAMFREFLGQTDIAGRFGGDEFVLLFWRKSIIEAEEVIAQFNERLAVFRFTWGQKSFPVEARFGMVPVDGDISSVSELFSAASHACHLAKEKGDGEVHVYRPNSSEVLGNHRALQWIANIRRNLSERHVHLYAQRIHPLSDNRKGLHFEILFRLLNTSGAPETIGGVIKTAELYGRMAEIDCWVIQHTLRHLGQLNHTQIENIDTCSINLSGISLRAGNMLDFIFKQFDRHRVPPQKICFEITETAAVQNIKQALWFMQELTAIGCRFAIDDFGSGMASYSYLKDFPVHYVKIDGVFVQDLVTNPLNRTLIESINEISHMLGMETVAEWVENDKVSESLKDIGVDYGQGYYLGRPLPLESVCGEKPFDIGPVR